MTKKQYKQLAIIRIARLLREGMNKATDRDQRNMVCDVLEGLNLPDEIEFNVKRLLAESKKYNQTYY